MKIIHAAKGTELVRTTTEGTPRAVVVLSVYKTVNPHEIWPPGRDSCVSGTGRHSCAGRFSGVLEPRARLVDALSGGSGVSARRDSSCRSVFRPASVPWVRLLPDRDAFTRARIAAAPSSRMLRAALASALSVCPQVRHRKTAWLSRFFGCLYLQTLQRWLVPAAGTSSTRVPRRAPARWRIAVCSAGAIPWRARLRPRLASTLFPGASFVPRALATMLRLFSFSTQTVS